MIRTLAICLIALFSSTAFAGEDVTLYDSTGRVLAPSQIGRASVRETCGACHDVDEQAKSLHFNKGEGSPDPESSECLSCHVPTKNAFNPDGTLRRAVSPTTSESCADCHSDSADKHAAGVHGRPDKRPGDHPTCHSCHGSAHAVKPLAGVSRARKAELCGGCHSDSARMARYGSSSEAVSSYEASFHGKSLLRFSKEESATCTDCHSHHDVREATDCDSGTNSANIQKTCAECHPGAKMNFCMSGANHLRLKMDKSIVLHLEDMFFKTLTMGTMLFLMGLIALDLRRKVFCGTCAPESGRFIASLIAASFCSMVVGLAMAFGGVRGAEWAWIASVGFAALAFLAHFVRRKPHKPAMKGEKLYSRFTVSQRVQHICLAASFTILVLTGMPLRFAHVEWSHYLHLLFGGFEGARIAHRVAAVVMAGTWIWHFFFLLYRWRNAGFSFRSWTMWPTRKDFADFIDTVRYGLGLRDAPPRYDRFQFREKFDYFAVYWGMPVMVFSGLVLWFPVFFGNRLTDLGLGMAYIAHSDEALLALLAILIWHLYNTHFDPDHFPMSEVWYSGVLTESDMEREHPIEKAALDAASASEAPSPPDPRAHTPGRSPGTGE